MRSRRHEAGARIWAPAVALLSMLVLLVGAGSASAVSWTDETDMVNRGNGRGTFVYDPGVGEFIDRGALLQAPLDSYYADQRFDRNFRTWAPTRHLAIGSAGSWAGCDNDPRPAPCPDGDLHFRPVSLALGIGTIRAVEWNGAFIALACGNFTDGGGAGPIPRITGVKYHDLNANGQRDAGEPGLPGWTMRLIYQGREVARTTTGAGGGYTFMLNANTLPIGAGTYRVEEVLTGDWVQSDAPGSVSVPLEAEDTTFPGNDFGNYRPATIAGSKFHDENVDGVWDALEPGLAGWTIGISPGGSQLTGRDGAYSFSVRPGTYTLQELLQDGWRQTAPAGDGTRRYTVTSGQVVDDADFGNVCLGEVSVKPVDDSTGLPLTGVEIRIEEVSVPDLIDNDPALPRTTTGTPDFGDLLPGTYRVIAFLPDDVYTTDDDLTLVDGRFAIVKQVTVKPCETTELPLRFFTQSRGKVTGGQVRFDLGDGFATSGFTFRTHRDGPRGTLQFNDHSRPSLKLHTREIGGIDVDDDGVVAHVWGDVEVDGALVRFHLRLVDAGEPGVDDRYELTLENGYRAGFGVTLSGGNVQIHD